MFRYNIHQDAFCLCARRRLSLDLNVAYINHRLIIKPDQSKMVRMHDVKDLDNRKLTSETS